MRLTVIILGLLVSTSPHAFTQEVKSEVDHWAPFRPLVGEWTGGRTGMGGDAEQKTSYEFVMNGQFLRCVTTTTSGSDPHEDVGYISYDKTRKKFVYRAFFSEGFINQYVATFAEDGKTIVFETESIENGPPGLRAREVINIDGDTIRQELQLASSDDGPFTTCITVEATKNE